MEFCSLGGRSNSAQSFGDTPSSLRKSLSMLLEFANQLFLGRGLFRNKFSCYIICFFIDESKDVIG